MKYFFCLGLFAFLFSGYVSKEITMARKTGGTSAFESFVKNFPAGALPYEITVPSSMYNVFNTMGHEAQTFIPEMKFSSFSRMTRSNGTYNVNLLKTSTFTLLIYTIEESVSDTLAPVSTSLATFDSTGKRIDKIEFSCQSTPDKFKTGTIDQHRNIVIREYKNIWMYDPKEKGYMGNEVVRKELESISYYTLVDNGHFVKGNPAPVTKPLSNHGVGARF